MAAEQSPKPNAVPASPKTTPKPLAQLEAEHQAPMQQAKQALETAETVDQRHSQIGAYVTELALNDPEGQKHLGVYLESEAFPDTINACLYDFECEYRERKPGYDLTKESPKRLARILQRGLKAQTKTDGKEQEIVSETAKRESAETAEDSLTTYQNAVDSLSGLSNMEKIHELLNNPTYSEVIPATEKAKLLQFQQVLLIASANEADKAIVTQSLSRIDLSNPPKVQDFVRAFIFDSPDSHIKSGVSEATQQAIAQQLGIVRHERPVVTGGDMQELFTQGIGTEKYLDEDGKLQERPVHLKAGETVEIRKGQYVGLSETKSPIMKIVGEHIYTADLPENPTDDDMTEYGLTIQWIAKLNDVNMAEIFFPHSMLERGGGHLHLHLPNDFHCAQRLCQIFFGGFAGYNGEILDESDLARIPYLMQFQNEKGDHAIGDVNPEQMKADYRRQGLLKKDGSLDWDKFRTMIESNRDSLFGSETNFGLKSQDQEQEDET